MTTVEKKVDAMARILLGVSDEERRSARNELCKLLDSPPLSRTRSISSARC